MGNFDRANELIEEWFDMYEGDSHSREATALALDNAEERGATRERERLLKWSKERARLLDIQGGPDRADELNTAYCERIYEHAHFRRIIRKDQP